MKDTKQIVEEYLPKLIAACAIEKIKRVIAQNEDKWITIHPHGKDGGDGEGKDYRRLLIKDGETVEDAMHRQGYYNKRKAKDEKALKEEKKQLYQDILKAKKEGNKELHHKLLQRYNEIDAQLKGQKTSDKGKDTDTKKEDKENKETDKNIEIKESKHFEKYNKLVTKEKELYKIWDEKRKEYDAALEKNNEYKELNTKITDIRKELMTTDYKDKEKYLALQKEKNELDRQKAKISNEIQEKIGLYDSQHKYEDASWAVQEERKNIIVSSTSNIKQQINKVSTRYDKVVQSLNTLSSETYAIKTNEYNDVLKQLDELREKRANYTYGTGEHVLYTKKINLLVDKEFKLRGERRKLAENFAKKVSKILQVENGLTLKTNAQNAAMEENAKRLKNVLDGIVPASNFSNNPININQTYDLRASQSGKRINLHNEERIGTIIHETAHQLEADNPQILINSLTFARARTEGEKQISLKKINSEYKRDEYCKRDKFFDPYCGKIYTLYGGKDRKFEDADGSEIMSMGLQHIFEDPINFAKNDREYFDFVISNLRGELWD